MTNTCDARPRPGHYRKSRWWEPALEALARRGWSDRQIADALTDLNPEAVEWMQRHDDWKAATVERLSDPGAGGAWTRRQVQYHRQRLNLPGRHRRLQCAADHRADERRLYQARQGWGHLLPPYDEVRQRWLPGHELQKREVDILTALRDRGSLTLKELSKGKRLTSDDAACMADLAAAGLVIVSRTCPRLYALLAPVHPEGRRQPTSVELAARALGIM